MKIDQINKNRGFTKRLLHDFTAALMELLQEKSLERITIAELCAKTSYPRSTFYNYFEDIYSLMDYCWESIGARIKIDKFQDIEHDKRTLALFEATYDYMDARRPVIDRLLRSNRVDGAMLRSLDAYIKKAVFTMVSSCEFSAQYPIPNEIMAQHYSNTVQMILSTCFLDKSITKQEALDDIEFLLGTLEKASVHK
ncbi:MAG: TetR/AcrR family transcriptional regulator [Atopobiaceae bacterium]|jgi:AcrR family transcriptional regulator|nr:TetR/AcrR family transcriptional regulator [Atopobiaceae bacterium]